MNPAFLRYDHKDVADLIAQNPLAWVLASHSDAEATPLPILGQQGADGELVALIGHLARSNPLVAALQENPRGLFLFSGPSGYITPGWVSKPGWAPTWNYAVVRIEAEIVLDADFTDEAVRLLVEKMEAGSARGWTVAQMGERYARMLPAIIGFRASVRDVRATFKLGQDESAQSLQEIVSAIGDASLGRWMRRFDNGDQP